MDSINEEYNEQLRRQIDGTLPTGFVYYLGTPSRELLSAGVRDLPIELAASRLVDKSMQENHPFELEEVFDLPNAIRKPIAVFRSATKVGAFVVLTRLKHNDGRNFVAALNVRKEHVEVNSVRSIHYRTMTNIVGWIADDLCEYFCPDFQNGWFETTKRELLSKPQYNSVDVRKQLSCAANVVKKWFSQKNNEKSDNSLNGLSDKEQLALNKRVEHLIEGRDIEGRTDYSEEEKEMLRQYTGAGGLKGATGKGVLSEFYTPQWLCDRMADIARFYGYKGGHILEPSCGIGRMVESFCRQGDYEKIDCMELQHTSARICKILHPEVEVYEGAFETAFLDYPRLRNRSLSTWLSGAPYDLIIGNPPYGTFGGKWSVYFSKAERTQLYETFFISMGLELLKSGGLLVYVINSSLMNNGQSYDGEKDRIGQKATFVDAVRLPPVFSTTDMTTDIIVLRKI